MQHFIGLFILIMGYIIGLGAVTVIDIHGFLGRKSNYWTEATTRTHKVTKPMIWAGTVLAIIGGLIYFYNAPFVGTPVYLAYVAAILILNGIFLSFSVSPFLLERERQGKSSELLPKSWQNKIMVSLIISDLGWWGSLIVIIWHVVNN
jgi:hypothetical protein